MVRFHPLMLERDKRVFSYDQWSRAVVGIHEKYVYFRIPKCANSTITATLGYYSSGITFQNVSGTTANSIKNQFPKLSATRCFTLDRLQKKFFLFTFCRHPVARLYSAYMDKIQSPTRSPHEYQWIAHRMGKTDKRLITFDDFICWLEYDGLFSNPHWIPQTAMLPVSPQRLDFVGKVETLEKDINLVIKSIFNINVIDIKNAIGHATNIGSVWEDIINQKLRRRIYKLYEQDYVTFGYEM